MTRPYAGCSGQRRWKGRAEGCILPGLHGGVGSGGVFGVEGVEGQVLGAPYTAQMVGGWGRWVRLQKGLGLLLILLLSGHLVALGSNGNTSFKAPTCGS